MAPVGLLHEVREETAARVSEGGVVSEAVDRVRPIHGYGPPATTRAQAM